MEDTRVIFWILKTFFINVAQNREIVQKATEDRAPAKVSIVVPHITACIVCSLYIPDVINAIFIHYFYIRWQLTSSDELSNMIITKLTINLKTVGAQVDNMMR